MIKVALIADSHLPDNSETVKEDVFDWALATAIEKQADVIVAVGDLTAMGTIEAAERVKQKLDATNLPYLITPGNAEIRTPEFTEAVLSELQTTVSFEQNDCYVFVLDSSRQNLTVKDRNMLNDLVLQGYKQIFVATHFPLIAFPQNDQDFLKELIASGTIGVFVAGHLHYNAVNTIGQNEYHLIRGLDPDKAIGGPPALSFLNYDSSNQYWQRSDYEYKINWTNKNCDEFCELLGISCMQDSTGGIKNAVQYNIKNIELRFENIKNISIEKLYPLIEEWRNKGGQNLSIHLPDIIWDQKNGEIKGVELVKEACKLALELCSNALTMHVPRCPVGLIDKHADIKEQIIDAYADALKAALTQRITVGIENLHMNPGEKPGSERGFGYTPDECLDWINSLRNKTGNDKIGFHFDIGHARNNAPYSSMYSISQWFAMLGDLITGYHLHQVEQDTNGNFINHRPITKIFGPLISFSSLFEAWNNNQIEHAPMYLEIRDGDALESLNCFHKYLNDLRK